MSTDEKRPSGPVSIAREAFRRLAASRIAPTPEAYSRAYQEVSGSTEGFGAESVLMQFGHALTRSRGELANVGQRVTESVEARDWDALGKALGFLGEKHLPRIAPTRKAAPTLASPLAEVARELLARTFTHAVSPLLEEIPDLARESEALGVDVRAATTEPGLNDISARLKQLCFRIDTNRAMIGEEREQLLHLLTLLLENVGELVEDDRWMRGQLDTIQGLLASPIDLKALDAAAHSLKALIYKQGALKHGLTEAKAKLKNMLALFIDRLGSMAVAHGDHHERMSRFTEEIGSAEHVSQLSYVLDDVMQEMRAVQAETLRSRDELLVAQQEAQYAEARIQELETELQHLSELVREDQLTGSLNRRGLDESYAREASRADRRDSPMCVAMLDLDDFKRLNDTHGHVAGDEALQHLVRLIKQTLRATEVVARFGGEEFVILMPDTKAEDAAMVLTRLQRKLTKRFFLYDNQKLLITFSGGVAQRLPGEEQADVLKRADEAVYRAKKAGKNRIVVA